MNNWNDETIDLFYKDWLKKRQRESNPVFEDVNVVAGGAPYVLNYHDRKHVFIYRRSGVGPLDLASMDSECNTQLVSNTWNNVSFREGTRFTVSVDSQFLVKATDEVIP